MTGKDLILYILNNDLENVTILEDGVLFRMINEEEAAIKFKVGTSTIKAWHELGNLHGIKIGKSIFFLQNVTDPRKNDLL